MPLDKAVVEPWLAAMNKAERDKTKKLTLANVYEINVRGFAEGSVSLKHPVSSVLGSAETTTPTVRLTIRLTENPALNTPQPAAGLSEEGQLELAIKRSTIEQGPPPTASGAGGGAGATSAGGGGTAATVARTPSGKVVPESATFIVDALRGGLSYPGSEIKLRDGNMKGCVRCTRARCGRLQGHSANDRLPRTDGCAPKAQCRGGHARTRHPPARGAGGARCRWTRRWSSRGSRR